eukprot:scaffold3836_cov417-Prasinococcus_capsulatus_cf.AAC.18
MRIAVGAAWAARPEQPALARQALHVLEASSTAGLSWHREKTRCRASRRAARCAFPSMEVTVSAIRVAAARPVRNLRLRYLQTRERYARPRTSFGADG